jgi:Cu-Zn family superoxide dismutase
MNNFFKKFIKYKAKYLNKQNSCDCDCPCPINQVIGIAVFKETIKGTVYFTEIDEYVKIDINLSGLPPSKKLGFHIHEAGDLTDGCASACAHLNPYKSTHGGPNSEIRHVGDLGNIITDEKGICIMVMTDNMITLRGYEKNIIGDSFPVSVIFCFFNIGEGSGYL